MVFYHSRVCLVLIIVVSVLSVKEIRSNTVRRHSDDICNRLSINLVTELRITHKDVVDVSICTKSTTQCCDHTMIKQLYMNTAFQLNNDIFKNLHYHFEIFHRSMVTFDEYFISLLEGAQQDLHDMFAKTYGLLYKQNAHIFLNLFDGLLKAYLSGFDNSAMLSTTLHNFFVSLWCRLFELFNAQYTFSDTYLECVGRQLNPLQPFGDVPDRLMSHVRQVFIAVQTFLHGLEGGRHVLHQLSKANVSEACTQAVVDMLYCQYCTGAGRDVALRPCSKLCRDTLHSYCLKPESFNMKWQNFLRALMHLAQKLRSTYNVEKIVVPMENDISQAILHFQQHVKSFSVKVFETCGEPAFEELRYKRDVSRSVSGSSHNERSAFSHREKWNENRRNFNRNVTSLPGVAELVSVLRSDLNKTKNIWKNLPSKVCNNLTSGINYAYEMNHGLSPQSNKDCLNKGSSNGFSIKLNKESDDVTQRALLTRVNNVISLLTHQLRNASKGLHVQFPSQGWHDDSLSGSDYTVDDLIDDTIEPGWNNWDEDENYEYGKIPETNIQRENNDNENSKDDDDTDDDDWIDASGEGTDDILIENEIQPVTSIKSYAHLNSTNRNKSVLLNIDHVSGGEVQHLTEPRVEQNILHVESNAGLLLCGYNSSMIFFVAYLQGLMYLRAYLVSTI